MNFGCKSASFYYNHVLYWILSICSIVNAGQICHVCNDIPRPQDCPIVKECGPHETCSTESYLSPNGNILYKMGCKDTAQCSGFTMNSVYTPVCSGCCSSDLCGVAMCGNSGYPIVRGPVCFNCIYQMDKPTHCGKIKICSRDEQCGVQKFDSGLYEVKCLTNSSCTVPEAHTTCTSCCTTDGCNRNCKLATECKDEDSLFCQSLLQTAPSFCSNPTLAVKCNETCLNGTRCDGIPGPKPGQGHTATMAPVTMPTTTPTTTIRPLTSQITNPSGGSGNTGYYFPDGTKCDDGPQCAFIKQSGLSYCSDKDLMNYCNMTCGICGHLVAASNPGGDPCKTHPCVHGQCQPQYGSALSTKETSNPGGDPCKTHPCVHGQCQPQYGSALSTYICNCELGYMGANCDHPDPCYKQPCVHGQCVVLASSGAFQCNCDAGFSGSLCDRGLVRDCQDVLDNRISSSTHDNIYVLDITESVLGSRKLNARCDFSSNEGWTVLMHRDSGHLDFNNQDSNQYALGFGNARDEFWTGLEYMHALTSDGRRYQLRIDMTVANGSHYFQIYDDFSVGQHNKFLLSVGRSYGNAGDSLSGHNNFGFTTLDRDQDSNSNENCARYISGGWWFHDCADSCLTCNYVTPGTKNCKSMSWQTLGYCIGLKAVTMKIRPL